MKKMRHWLAHLLGWNYGRVTSELREGVVWIGFKCDGCGLVHDWHESLARPRSQA